MSVFAISNTYPPPPSFPCVRRFFLLGTPPPTRPKSPPSTAYINTRSSIRTVEVATSGGHALNLRKTIKDINLWIRQCANTFDEEVSFCFFSLSSFFLSLLFSLVSRAMDGLIPLSHCADQLVSRRILCQDLRQHLQGLRAVLFLSFPLFVVSSPVCD